MTAQQAATALATPVVCRRRAGSMWTACQCLPCRRTNARMDKAHRLNMLPSIRREEAVARLLEWRRLGWQASAIASAIGHDIESTRALMTRLVRGHHQLHTYTVRRVLNATEPTFGEWSTVGSTRRLQALAWMGWDRKDLHEQIGVSKRALSMIRQGKQQTVKVVTARRIDEVYRELQNVPGPTRAATAFAERTGWAPPAVWDEDSIDDPDRKADGVATGITSLFQPTDTVVIDEIRELHRVGWSDADIAQRVGRSKDAVYKLRHRYGIRRAS